MKREWTLRCECAHPGCLETATYRYQTKRDLQTSFELKNYGYGRDRWKCIRHSRPTDVISATNLSTHFEIVSRSVPNPTIPAGESRYFGNHGFMHGPGFKVFAEDFPVGTKLIVTARVELPQNIKDAQGDGK